MNRAVKIRWLRHELGCLEKETRLAKMMNQQKGQINKSNRISTTR